MTDLQVNSMRSPSFGSVNEFCADADADAGLKDMATLTMPSNQNKSPALRPGSICFGKSHAASAKRVETHMVSARQVENVCQKQLHQPDESQHMEVLPTLEHSGADRSRSTGGDEIPVLPVPNFLQVDEERNDSPHNRSSSSGCTADESIVELAGNSAWPTTQQEVALQSISADQPSQPHGPYDHRSVKNDCRAAKHSSPPFRKVRGTQCPTPTWGIADSNAGDWCRWSKRKLDNMRALVSPYLRRGSGQSRFGTRSQCSFEPCAHRPVVGRMATSVVARSRATQNSLRENGGHTHTILDEQRNLIKLKDHANDDQFGSIDIAQQGSDLSRRSVAELRLPVERGPEDNEASAVAGTLRFSSPSATALYLRPQSSVKDHRFVLQVVLREWVSCCRNKTLAQDFDVFLGQREALHMHLDAKHSLQLEEWKPKCQVGLQREKKLHEAHWDMEALWKGTLCLAGEEDSVLHRSAEMHDSSLKNYASMAAMALINSNKRFILFAVLHTWDHWVDRHRIQQAYDMKINEISTHQQRLEGELEVKLSRIQDEHARAQSSWNRQMQICQEVHKSEIDQASAKRSSELHRYTKKLIGSMIECRVHETFGIIFSHWMREVMSQRYIRDVEARRAAHHIELEARNVEAEHERTRLREVEAECERLRDESEKRSREAASPREKYERSLEPQDGDAAGGGPSISVPKSERACHRQGRYEVDDNSAAKLDLLRRSVEVVDDRRRYDLMLLIPGMQRLAEQSLRNMLPCQQRAQPPVFGGSLSSFTESNFDASIQAPSLQPAVVDSESSITSENSQYDTVRSSQLPPNIDEISVGILAPACAHSAPRVNRRPARRRWSRPASTGTSIQSDRHCARNSILPAARVRLAQQRVHRDAEEREPATTSRVPKRRHVVRCRRCAAPEAARHLQPVPHGTYGSVDSDLL